MGVTSAASSSYVAMTGIYKQYGDYEASKDVNFEITEGRIDPVAAGRRQSYVCWQGLNIPTKGIFILPVSA